MNPFLAFATAHWFAVLLLLLALAAGALALFGKPTGRGPWAVTAAGLALAGVGGLLLEPEWGAWIAV
ncbi:MAG TPA: hypothetical protein VFA26_09225, partial [Gemmataceae bacterium]|nr:hypothetical protein [Gemmataceae bacterium]